MRDSSARTTVGGPRQAGAPAPPAHLGHSLTPMRAVQITEFGGPEVMDIVDLPDPVPGDGQQLYDVSTAGINFADTHHRRSPQQTIV